MAGIGFASVDTDVSSLVNAAFDEIECCIPTEFGEHEGCKVAFMDNHGCDSGYVCFGHYTRHLAARIESSKRTLASGKTIRCLDCNGIFRTIDEWISVYPL
ncbi:hypothetical protein [Mycobacteroides abscessus]|uniref:hypothetical protein n=1 Tax=Mycobacteroides abscessus TaxID=36809 RepID=UPI0010571DDC|nr:hypothetical protein [Mycobacteroides abscessus]